MKFDFIEQNGIYIIRGYKKEDGQLAMEQPFNSFTDDNFTSEEDCKNYLSLMYPLNEARDETIEIVPPQPEEQPLPTENNPQ